MVVIAVAIVATVVGYCYGYDVSNAVLFIVLIVIETNVETNGLNFNLFRGYVLDIWHSDLLNDGRKAAVQIAQALIHTDEDTGSSQSASNEAVRKVIDVLVEIQVRVIHTHTFIYIYAFFCTDS